MRFLLMKQKVVPNRAYMLRDDGKLLDCGKQSIHPYILFKGVAESADDVIEMLTEDEVYQDQYLWCMKYTNKSTTKSLFRQIIPMLIKRAIDNGQGQQYALKSLFDFHDDVSNVDTSDLQSKLMLLNNEINQEFLRVRVGDKYQNVSSGNDIYFRISSAGFNWGDYIWQIVNDNKHSLDTVTVCKDKDSTGSEQYLSHGGQIINHMPVTEFLTLSGNLYLESTQSINPILQKLAAGLSIQEAFGENNLVRLNQLYNVLRAKELEF